MSFDMPLYAYDLMLLACLLVSGLSLSVSGNGILTRREAAPDCCATSRALLSVTLPYLRHCCPDALHHTPPTHDPPPTSTSILCVSLAAADRASTTPGLDGQQAP